MVNKHTGTVFETAESFPSFDSSHIRIIYLHACLRKDYLYLFGQRSTYSYLYSIALQFLFCYTVFIHNL